jgi:hypothetical protein
MSEVIQLAKMEVIFNDLHEHPSCPHGIFIVVYFFLRINSITVLYFYVLAKCDILYHYLFHVVPTMVCGIYLYLLVRLG